MAYENPNVRWEYPQAEQNPWLQLYPNALNIFGVPSLRETTSPSYAYSSYDIKQPLLDRWTKYNDKQLANTVAPNFEWANTNVLGTVYPNQFNSKTMPLISQDNQTYGIGIANLNWTPSNIHKQVDRIRANQNVKAGGQEQIFDAMTDWAKSRNWKNKPRKKALLDYLYKPNYLESLERKSQRNENWKSPLRMDDILQASDYAIRETSRAQQHKSDWLDNTLKAITNPSTWMNATHAYLTGNPQSAYRAVARFTGDAKGSPSTQSTNQYGVVDGSGINASRTGGDSKGEKEDPVTVEMNPYVTRRNLQAIIQRGQQEEEERKRLVHRLGEYSPTFAKRGLIQPVQPIRSRLLG